MTINRDSAHRLTTAAERLLNWRLATIQTEKNNKKNDDANHASQKPRIRPIRFQFNAHLRDVLFGGEGNPLALPLIDGHGIP